MKVYLAGPINGRTDADCKDWREYAKTKLLDTLDPMVRDYRGKEQTEYVDIVEQDKRDIDECDALLVMYDKPSVGTSMEILYAFDAGKVVVLVNQSKKPLSPWLLYHCTKIVSTLDEGIALVGGMTFAQLYDYLFDTTSGR